MQWLTTDIDKEKRIPFELSLDLKAGLMARSSEVLDLTRVEMTGVVTAEDGLYGLDFTATYDITLPSTRSLRPVVLPMEIRVSETYVSAELADRDPAAFVLEGEAISLDEAVADNILLEIPTRILTADELSSDELPKGQDWRLLSEEDYAREKEEKKAESSAFKALDGLFE